MRDIKFRVWDKVDYMSEPFTLHELKAGLVQFTHDCPVMQYTGLKDNNSVEVYEGDIVNLVLGRHEVVTGQVCYELGGFWFHSDMDISFVIDSGVDNKVLLADLYQHYKCQKSCLSAIEVIGNVHQNPELLETSTNY